MIKILKRIKGVIFFPIKCIIIGLHMLLIACGEAEETKDDKILYIFK